MTPGQQTLADAIAHATDLFHRRILVQSFGLFWLAAEAAILVAVLYCHHRFVRSDRPFPRACIICPALPVVLAAAVFARHAVMLPLPRAIASASTPQAVLAAYALRARVHIAFWASCITAWVVLESAIVFVAWRAYRRIVPLLQPTPRNPHPLLGAAVLALALTAGTTAAASGFAASPVAAPDAYFAAHEAFDPARNLLALYLRLAGVVWIAVEAVAAVILARFHYRVRASLREAGP